MSQRDPRDPWWVPAPLVGPKPKGPIKVALAKLPADMDVDPSVRAALRQAADHLERSGYRVSEVEVPDINGVWQTWCDIITNEIVVMQEAAMLKVTSSDFHAAWNGIKAGANTLDLQGWMRATAARSTHIRAWQLFFEDYPGRARPDDGEADAWPARGYDQRRSVRANCSGTTCVSFPRSMCSACPALSCPSRYMTAGRSVCSLLRGAIARISRWMRRRRSRSAREYWCKNCGRRWAERAPIAINLVLRDRSPHLRHCCDFLRYSHSRWIRRVGAQCDQDCLAWPVISGYFGCGKFVQVCLWPLRCRQCFGLCRFGGRSRRRHKDRS